MILYATYLINASKVWLLCIVHTNLSINEKQKNKHFHVLNYPCGNRLSARAPRAQQGSCRIW